jgi:hypothetical protein
MMTAEDRQRRLKVFDLRLESLVRQRCKYNHESVEEARAAVQQSPVGRRIGARRELLLDQQPMEVQGLTLIMPSAPKTAHI